MPSARAALALALINGCLARPAGAPKATSASSTLNPGTPVKRGALQKDVQASTPQAAESPSAFASAPALDAHTDPEASPDPAQVPAATPLPAFEIERPYGPGQRARTPGIIASSVEDEILARWNLGGSGDPSHPSGAPNYHPAVRVVVETKALSRLPRLSTRRAVLTESRLLAAARRTGYWPFRSCYEAALRRSPEISGLTRVRITVSVSGKITASRLLSSELRDHEGARCLARATRALRIEPAPARRLDVDLSVELWPGDAPLPALSTTLAVPAFDPDAVFSRVSERSGELARCYVAGLERDRALWGRLALRVQVDAQGRFGGAREEESRFPDAEVVQCAIDALGDGPFPSRGQPYEFMLALRCGVPPTPRDVTPPAAE